MIPTNTTEEVPPIMENQILPNPNTVTIARSQQQMAFPPPPKTVEVWCAPMHQMVSVFAYAHSKDIDEPFQRVLWNPTEGRWEIDETRARWAKARGAGAAKPYTLNTIWPEELIAERNERYRQSQREAQESTEARLAEVERQLNYLLKEFGVTVPEEPES